MREPITIPRPRTHSRRYTCQDICQIIYQEPLAKQLKKIAVIVVTLIAIPTATVIFNGCGSPKSDDSNTTSNSNTSNSAGSNSANANSNGNSPTSPNSSTPSTPSSPPAPPPTTPPATATPIRFVVLGDAGEGNTAQYAVADTIGTVCQAKGGCEFALYLGDNFYNDGVFSVTDTQFQSKFELPYANLDFPFYVVLGNHDYGWSAVRDESAAFEVAYYRANQGTSKWYLPSRYYQVSHTLSDGAVDFFALDTNAVMMSTGLPSTQNRDTQIAWFDAAVAQSSATWKIAFGHHPFLSNGRHGNAGNYDGRDWLPNINGDDINSFVTNSMCGKIDVYFCGHDHNRQWLEPTCGTEFIVSGAGSKTTSFVGRDNNPTFFEEYLKEGFLYVEIVSNTLTGEFYDSAGNLEFTRTITK